MRFCVLLLLLMCAVTMWSLYTSWYKNKKKKIYWIMNKFFSCFFSDGHWSFKRLKLYSPLISDLLLLESRIYIYINIGWICPDKTSILDTRNSRFFNQNPYHPTAKTFWRWLVLGFSIKFYSMHVPFFSFGLNKLVLCLCIYVCPIFFSSIFMDLLGEDIKAIGLLRGPNYPKSFYGVRVQIFLMSG